MPEDVFDIVSTRARPCRNSCTAVSPAHLKDHSPRPLPGPSANSGSDFSIDSYSTAPSIGAGDHSGSPGAYLMQGYFDEIRFSKVCRYTSNFTPSTTAFASDSDTVLLIHSDFTGTGLGTDSSGQGNNFGLLHKLDNILVDRV